MSDQVKTLTCIGNLMISLSRNKFVKNPCTSSFDFGPPMFNMRIPVLGLDERFIVVEIILAFANDSVAISDLQKAAKNESLKNISP